ncbi:MAG TPA: HAMP domain-containing protein [Stellaceae bacterium]|nr:HAMP domain-containing protein [Stellaceae bacterium]
MSIGGMAGKLQRKLALSIRGKMLLTAFLSLGVVAFLSILHLQLGWNIAARMAETDRVDQRTDSLVAMRMAILQSEVDVRGLGRDAKSDEENLRNLGIDNKDFEGDFKKIAGFVREGGKAVGLDEDDFHLDKLVGSRIKPALKGGDRAEIAKAIDEYCDKANRLNDLFLTLATDSTKEMRSHFVGTSTAIDRAERVNIATFIGAFVMLVPLFFFSTRSILRPLRQLTLAMQELARGVVELAVPARDRQDEIGAMAATVEVFRANTEKMQSLERERTEMQQRAAEERKRLMEDLAGRFDERISGDHQRGRQAQYACRCSHQSGRSDAAPRRRCERGVDALHQQRQGDRHRVRAIVGELEGSGAADPALGRHCPQGGDRRRGDEQGRRERGGDCGAHQRCGEAHR